MDLLAPSCSTLTPAGFRPRPLDPRLVLDVEAGTVWGADDLEPLRAAALVRVTGPAAVGAAEAGAPMAAADGGADEEPATPLGAALRPEELTASTVLGLSLAGVPVEGGSLPAAARALVDAGLLDLLDQAAPDAVADPQRREQLCLAVRRRAWAVTGYPRGTDDVVAVLLPAGEVPDTLRADLGAQTWPAVVPVPTHDDPDRDAEALAGAARDGAVYCCRVRADVRYGPEHLADLVHALRHSGAARALSPVRFWPWRGEAWLEDDTVPLERLVTTHQATGGLVLDGGSLWYAADGPAEPGTPGYALHGGNAVPVPTRSAGPDRVAPWLLHEQTPTLLSWTAGGA